MATVGLVRQRSVQIASDPEVWIRDGRRMATRDPQGVFDAIKGKHTAEADSFEAVSQALRAEGQFALARDGELTKALEAANFDAGRHLAEIAQARVDLFWALALLVVNAALALIVLFGLGPSWITCLLAFLVLATALPVEEFFVAHDDEESLREGMFLVLAVIGLGATFWLGGLRGLFLGAMTNAEWGPANRTLMEAAHILQFSFAGLSVVSEFLCGYKFYRWRRHWHSHTAQLIRERDRCKQRLVNLHGALKASDVEADVRREYRTIGAKQQLVALANARSHHLQKAVLGALIALLVLAGLLMLAGTATAAQASPRPVVVLFDLTASTRPDSFAANKAVVRDVIKTLAVGQRVVVIGIADKFGNAHVLMDRQLPKNAGYLGLEARASQERLLAEWDRLSESIALKYKETDIIGALAFLGHLGRLREEPLELIVLSDLRQSVDVDIERPPKIDARATLGRVQHGNGIPRLNGVDVYLLGVDPTGKSVEYFRGLREFWTQFFAAAGARVLTFSIDRRLPELNPRR